MKKFLLVFLLIGLCAAVTFTDTFSLRNGTAYVFYFVFISSHDDEDPGDDWLAPTQVLRPGQTVEFTMPEPLRGRGLDIIILDEDGDLFIIADRIIEDGEIVTVTMDDFFGYFDY